MAARRPISILIAALGGQGGGVLTEWIAGAAAHAGLPAQAISEEVLLEKYAKGGERTIDDVRRRVARALAAVESLPSERRAPARSRAPRLKTATSRPRMAGPIS